MGFFKMSLSSLLWTNTILPRKKVLLHFSQIHLSYQDLRGLSTTEGRRQSLRYVELASFRALQAKLSTLNCMGKANGSQCRFWRAGVTCSW